ncbi:hypothetical protein FQU75_24890 [Paenibacillus polymyxa]|uniref:Sporulation membrane protein YtrI C-terminal domain-containing protein n=1 Tax=Paenibacillus ottowii TaxID=2315729 RepID=A0ABY3B3Y4_9BACL|nr:MULTISPECIES: hypothetical protein [Paenibacillus]KZE66666.1 hypothetical protein AV545_03315 [Paenibacillus jamilae]NEU25052.1 hypothetical protein [Paenibacillus polymyxa]OBA06193.1 hypothetical protein A9P44_04605 [Paenibacillus polymyxa]QDY86288.1 hypothetical protein FQU75_24890 [Paenibacillus polymyxa]TQR98581.1 hypothetical protein FKV70_10325 [Paenibacillus ottowii]
MRVPPFERLRPFMQLSSVFVLGMITGGMIYNAIWHASFNQLWTNNQDLQFKLQQAEEDNKTLRKYSKRQTVVKEIKLIAEEASAEKIDAINLKELLRRVSRDLEVLRGRDMFEIDSDSKLVRMLLNQKKYTVRDKEYTIQVKTMLVMEGVLQIWLEAKERLPQSH